MSGYFEEYRKKLTTPEKAVEYIQDGATIVPGMVNAEPPALLAAIADALVAVPSASLTALAASWAVLVASAASCKIS